MAERAILLAAGCWFATLRVLAAEPVATPQFDNPAAFCDRPFALTISCATPGAVIYYSVDCSEPSLERSPRYTAPIQIAETSVVRARAFREGMLPSSVDTRTYLFLQDVIAQAPDGKAPLHFPASWGGNAVDYGMDPNVIARHSSAEWRESLTQVPSISLVTEMRHLFDPATGIYANALERGREWERAASIELLDPARMPERQFQENCGLRIRGGYSRHAHYPKHSFRVFFRREYGVAKLAYPLFDTDGASEFDTFDLRTSQNYSWAIDGVTGFHDTMVQDAFCRETLGALSQPTTRSRYYHLYLNGQYWGLFETQERANAGYGSSYFPGRKEDFDAVKSANHPGGFVIEASDGTLDAFRTLWTMARSLATNASNEKYFVLLGRNPDGTRQPSLPVLLDVDNLIDYMLVLFYTGDGDGALSSFANYELANNWFALRNRNDPSRGFVFFNHDAEHTLGAPYAQVDRTGPFVRPNQTNFAYANPHWLHQDLMANAEYRLRFADHVQRHFFNHGALTPEAAAQRYLAKAARINKAIRAYSARWGDAQREPPWGEADWARTIENTVRFWFPWRTGVVLQQLREDGLYPAVSAAGFSHQGGAVPDGYAVAMNAGNSQATIYFTRDGADPRLPGGAVAPGARIYDSPVLIAAPTLLRARVLDRNQWSALTEAWFFPASTTLMIEKSASGVLLTLPLPANLSYTLRYSDNLGITPWRVLTNIAPSSGARMIRMEDPRYAPARFYRGISLP